MDVDGSGELRSEFGLLSAGMLSASALLALSSGSGESGAGSGASLVPSSEPIEDITHFDVSNFSSCTELSAS